MSQKVGGFTIRVERTQGFELKTTFDKAQYAPLMSDEPAPLGKDTAPNPARILAAAIGECLTASLVFCMQKQGAPIDGISADVKVELVRNDDKRLRIGSIDVALHPRLGPGDPAVYDKCLSTFEDFCVVTQSVRAGLDVNVRVEPTEGEGERAAE
jgi:uncharacterized OsmC-like protein